MVRNKKNNSKKYVKSQYILAGLLLLVLILFGFFYFFVDSKLDRNADVKTTEIELEQQTKQEIDEPEVKGFDNVKLQEVIDSWTANIAGTSSIVISNIDGDVLASHNPNQVYFAASIYKIYVAYAGYQQIESGEVDPNETYVNGYTRLECLDLMIRDSDSPCAEKLWNELGKEELTNQLQAYGIDNTSMGAVSTSAYDAAILLSRIARGEGLNDTSRTAYLESMKDQDDLYRRGLPSGFESLVVYNKVGWNELKEWHDTAIVELEDGRQLVVSVMSENVGFSNVIELGKSLENYLMSL